MGNRWVEDGTPLGFLNERRGAPREEGRTWLEQQSDCTASRMLQRNVPTGIGGHRWAMSERKEEEEDICGEAPSPMDPEVCRTWRKGLDDA